MGLRDYLRILLRHRVYAGVTFLAVFLLIALWTFTQSSIYEAEAKLLIKQKSSSLSAAAGAGLAGGAGGAFGQLSSVAFGNPLDTQAELIQSRPVAETVIKRLSLQDSRREGPLKPEDFLKILKVQPLRRTDLLSIKYKDSDADLAAKVVNSIAQVYTNLNVQTNRAEATSTRQFVEGQLPRIEAQLRESERKLRLFKEQYGSIALEQEGKAAVASLSQFENDQAKISIELAGASARVQSLGERLGMSERDAVVATALAKTEGIRDLRKELLEVEGKLAISRTQFQDSYPEVDQLIKRRVALSNLLGREVNKLFGTSTNTETPSLVDSDAGDVPTLSSQSPGDNLPRIDAVRQALVDSFVSSKVEEIVAQTRLVALDAAAQRYTKLVSDFPRLEETQRQLEREAAAKQEAYQLLLKRFQETRILEAENIGNVTLVEPAAVPEIPIWPRKSLNLIVGAVLGLILGVVIAFAREFLNESVRTVDEAKNILKANVLGMIPLFSSDKPGSSPGTSSELITLKDPLSPASEAYRSVRTNIKFLGSDKPIRAVVFSSCMPREGKSTTSANFAVVSAQLGARVLLVDADLRKPRQHKVWNLPNLQGLTSVLVGDANWRQIIQPTAHENLAVLTAGPLPPSDYPPGLLESKRMFQLLQELCSEYDLVVVDTPPLTAAADASVLTAMCDGLVLVVRPNVVNKRILAKVRDSLMQNRVNLLGQVVNGVVAENEGYTYYLYYNRYPSENPKVVSNGTPVRNGASNGGNSSWFKLFSNSRDK